MQGGLVWLKLMCCIKTCKQAVKYENPPKILQISEIFLALSKLCTQIAQKIKLREKLMQVIKLSFDLLQDRLLVFGLFVKTRCINSYPPYPTAYIVNEKKDSYCRQREMCTYLERLDIYLFNFFLNRKIMFALFALLCLYCNLAACGLGLAIRHSKANRPT